MDKKKDQTQSVQRLTSKSQLYFDCPSIEEEVFEEPSDEEEEKEEEADVFFSARSKVKQEPTINMVYQNTFRQKKPVFALNKKLLENRA